MHTTILCAGLSGVTFTKTKHGRILDGVILHMGRHWTQGGIAFKWVTTTSSWTTARYVEYTIR